MTCDDLAPLIAALPLGILDEGERSAVEAHSAVCERCPGLETDVAAALALTVPSVVARPAATERTWKALEARLTEARAQRETASELAVKISLSCSYCHGSLTRPEAAFCAGCLAPHHEECFATHGRCSALGCSEEQVVRPGAARAPHGRWTRSRRLGSWSSVVLTGSLATLACVSVAGFAFVATSQRSGGPRVPKPLGPLPLLEDPATVSSGPALPTTAPPTPPSEPTLPAIEEGLDPKLAAQRLVEQAASLLARGEYALAQRVLGMALERHPESASAYHHLGQARVGLGQHRAAAVAFSRAIALDPSGAGHYRARARVRVSLGQLEGAISDLRRVIELEPGRAESWVQLGEVRRAAGTSPSDLGEAIDYFRKAVELDPSLVEGWVSKGVAEQALGQNAAAVESFDQALRLDPRDGDVFRRRGAIYLDLGALDAAERDLSRAIQVGGRDAEAYAKRAQVLLEAGRRADALVDMARALELDPQGVPDVEAWFDGCLAGSDGLQVASEARALRRSSPWVQFAYGRAQYRAGPHGQKLRNAESSYRRALDLDPKNPLVLKHLGLVLFKQERLEDAVKMLSRALVAVPDQVEVLTWRGSAWAALGDDDAASADVSRAIELAPSDPRLRTTLASLLQRGGAHRRAIQELSVAISLDGSYLSAYLLRGQSWEALGEETGEGKKQAEAFERAGADYGFALGLAPTSRDAWLRSGLLKRRRGALAAARRDLQEFLKLVGPDDPQAAEIREWLASDDASQPSD